MKHNPENIRVVTIDANPTLQNLGSFVPRGHFRDVLALQFQLISGGGTSGASCNVYDTWGTSNSLIYKFIVAPVNGSGYLTSTTGTGIISIPSTRIWPPSPRPDFAIGHVKESGVAQVNTSGGAVAVTMVFADKPGGSY